MGKFVAYLLFLGLLAIGAAWYAHTGNGLALPFLASDAARQHGDLEWVDELHSRNPSEAKAAVSRVSRLGERAIPDVRAALREGGLERQKAALRACVVLAKRAAPLVPDVAALLPDRDLTEEAAMALSFMGREAFGPLRQALKSPDPLVRREAIRSIGKLVSRAPVSAEEVVPLLVSAMSDSAHSVRAVAATYLGIIGGRPDTAVPALIAGLEDPSIEVRRASATALGAFGPAAAPAVPALRKAAGHEDRDLAREAGRALINVRPQGR